jgi:hypothetical protein
MMIKRATFSKPLHFRLIPQHTPILTFYYNAIVKYHNHICILDIVHLAHIKKTTILGRLPDGMEKKGKATLSGPSPTRLYPSPLSTCRRRQIHTSKWLEIFSSRR